jgi:hypothetical protein
MEKKSRMHKHALNAKKTDKLDRTELLELLGGMIKDATIKVSALRIRDVKTFKARLDALKTIAYSMSVYKTVLGDEELDSIMDRITAIEEGLLK